MKHLEVISPDCSDRSTDQPWETRYRSYFLSHRAETLGLLGASPEAELEILVRKAAQEPKVFLTPSSVQLEVSSDEAQRTLVRAQAFQWANGVVVIPTVTRLLEAKALSLGGPDRNETLAQIAARVGQTDSEKNWGNLWGAFRLLGLQGWLVTEGINQDSRFRLTELGRAALELIEDSLAIFQQVTDAIASIKNYHALCHRELESPESIHAYASLVQQSCNGWLDTKEPGTVPGQRAKKHLCTLLDGLLIAPTMVALGMPQYERRGAALGICRAAVFDHLNKPEFCLLADFSGLNQAFLSHAFDLLEGQGIVAKSDDGAAVRLTELGRIHARLTPPLAALPVSYLRSYEQLSDLLFGNPDPLNIAADQHIDRVMNVYGSSGAGSGPAAMDICENILADIFNATPIEAQPAGIADMGCGDGTSLKRLADYIIDHTTRGKHLGTYPLVVIGADFNHASLERTRETLSAYAHLPGVHPAVIWADITQPDAYDQAIQASELRIPDHQNGGQRRVSLRDLVHTFMFLVHNRRLQLTAESEARACLRERIAAVDRGLLGDTLSRYWSLALPEDDAALYDLIIGRFSTSYSNEKGLVTGVTAAADLIRFMQRWKPFILHGFVALEGHSMADRSAEEEVPEDPSAWMQVEQLPHPLNWGMHYISRQYMMPFQEYILAVVLAGFAPKAGWIGGRIHGKNIPGLDLLPSHRFFSIACFQPVDAR